MKNIKSHKATIIELMHHVHANDTLDIDEVTAGINDIMQANNLQFKPACEIDGFIPDVSNVEESFYYHLNSPKYNSLPWFASLVEEWIDVTPLVAIDNLRLAKNRVESGDFSFEAMGAMIMAHNKVIYPNIFKRA